MYVNVTDPAVLRTAHAARQERVNRSFGKTRRRR